mmetsp:Transcript_28059/g.63787  ORF Transcript_28059/g.63787 Transcript_28059/m.63787 type:complete len:250 (+) Transcript_28059:221-970(+)
MPVLVGSTHTPVSSSISPTRFGSIAIIADCGKSKRKVTSSWSPRRFGLSMSMKSNSRIWASASARLCGSDAHTKTRSESPSPSTKQKVPVSLSTCRSPAPLTLLINALLALVTLMTVTSFLQGAISTRTACCPLCCSSHFKYSRHNCLCSRVPATKAMFPTYSKMAPLAFANFLRVDPSLPNANDNASSFRYRVSEPQSWSEMLSPMPAVKYPARLDSTAAITFSSAPRRPREDPKIASRPSGLSVFPS